MTTDPTSSLSVEKILQTLPGWYGFSEEKTWFLRERPKHTSDTDAWLSRKTSDGKPYYTHSTSKTKTNRLEVGDPLFRAAVLFVGRGGLEARLSVGIRAYEEAVALKWQTVLDVMQNGGKDSDRLNAVKIVQEQQDKVIGLKKGEGSDLTVIFDQETKSLTHPTSTGSKCQS